MAVRQVCTLGAVPWLAERFVHHGVSARDVTKALAEVVYRHPDQPGGSLAGRAVRGRRRCQRRSLTARTATI